MIQYQITLPHLAPLNMYAHFIGKVSVQGINPTAVTELNSPLGILYPRHLAIDVSIINLISSFKAQGSWHVLLGRKDENPESQMFLIVFQFLVKKGVREGQEDSMAFLLKSHVALLS